MRLIDADALIEAHYQHCNEHHGDTDIFYGWSLELMQNAPTIDAVPVILCKDCKHFKSETENTGICNCGFCNARLHVAVIDFCSNGERKDNEID